ncbi:MAG: phasin family protein [Anaerolineae bacterium]|nr:phasin family protein [Anaerolineae bacterium]
MSKKEGKEGGFVATFRKVILASVGAVGVAQDEVTGLINRMVERGELTEKDARKLIGDAQKEFNKRRRSGQTKAEKEMEGMMEKLNVPSKADIEDLTKQVAQLSKRIEELKTEMGNK